MLSAMRLYFGYATAAVTSTILSLGETLIATFEVYVASLADTSLVVELGGAALKLPLQSDASVELLFGLLAAVVCALKRDR